MADGTYATPVPLQIFAYRTAQIIMTSMARGAWGKQSLLGGRILELIRIRSAQLGECQPCMQSRKHDSITDEDVACLIAPGHSDLTEQERLAVEFLDLLSADHHAIDDEIYRRAGRGLHRRPDRRARASPAPTPWVLHRFIHTLDVFGDEPTGDRLRPRTGRHRLRRGRRTGAGMSETVFVTGATGLAGANVCKLLIERGDHVRALARDGADTGPLVRPRVSRSSPATSPTPTTSSGPPRAADAAIHCAALLGGASQDLADFEAVNVDGTKHVLDAAEALGMRRVVAVSTGHVLRHHRAASTARTHR